MTKGTLLFLCLLSTIRGVFAQDSLSTADNSSSSVLDLKKIKFSGYVDCYYFSNLNNPASRDNLGISGNARAFDQRSGTIGIGLVQAKMNYAPSEKTFVVLDLTFGPNADLGNYGNLTGPLGSNSTALSIKQAYLNWKPLKKLTLTAGQFGTHIGYEVIDAPDNYNYSLSNLFNNGPFYHIGAKAQYDFSDRFYIMAGVVNNIDALYDNNRAKGLIAQVYVSPIQNWHIYFNGIASNEASADSTGKSPYGGQYYLGDLTTKCNITDKWLVGLNAAFGSARTADVESDNGSYYYRTWGGAALYTNYTFNPKFSLGARYEIFDNSSAVRALRVSPTDGVVMNSATLTATFVTEDEHLLIKPEIRMDMANKEFFNGDTAGLYDKTSQTTVGLALIYKY